VNDSVYKNLEFVEASTYEEPAEINVKTLGSLGAAPDRDVYLYLETLNMPAHTTSEAERRRRGAAEAEIQQRFEAISKELPEPQQDARTHGFSFDVPEIEGAPEWFLPLPEDIEKLEPMYRIHVWHDTGETVTEENGSVRKLLRAQTSFGYVVRHDGPLYGWEPTLTGPGLVEIAPKFYRLSVPVEGTATVTTRIVAHDRPRGGLLSGCYKWLLAALALLAAAIRKLLKR